MPDLNRALLNTGNRDHFDRQHRATAYLDQAELGGWSCIWETMKTHGVSIKQQHMLALGARLQRMTRREMRDTFSDKR